MNKKDILVAVLIFVGLSAMVMLGKWLAWQTVGK